MYTDIALKVYKNKLEGSTTNATKLQLCFRTNRHDEADDVYRPDLVRWAADPKSQIVLNLLKRLRLVVL
jgi:hypothetical protein